MLISSSHGTGDTCRGSIVLSGGSCSRPGESLDVTEDVMPYFAQMQRSQQLPKFLLLNKCRGTRAMHTDHASPKSDGVVLSMNALPQRLNFYIAHSTADQFVSYRHHNMRNGSTWIQRLAEEKWEGRHIGGVTRAVAGG